MLVSEERLGGVVDALHVQAETSRREEEGCLRFEVFQDEEDPRRIFIHEVYATKADFEDLHRSTPHFARWREALDGALLEERVVFRLLPLRLEL